MCNCGTSLYTRSPPFALVQGDRATWACGNILPETSATRAATWRHNHSLLRRSASLLPMTTSLEGSCNCGNVRVLLKKGYEGKKGWLCHCIDCQKSGGCLSSFVVGIPPENLVYTSGAPKVYKQPNTESGRPLLRYFCGDCGTPITSHPEGLPVTFVKAALFDNQLAIQGEVFWKNAQEWEKKMARDDMIFEGNGN